jgi:hypothetical protein
MTRAPLWKNPRILSTLLFVFLAGAVGGAIIVRACYQPERHRLAPPWNAGGKELLMPHYTKELNLDAEQESEIAQILDDYMRYVQLLEEQMTDVRATGKKRILKVLRDDQKKKFENLLNEARPASR